MEETEWEGVGRVGRDLYTTNLTPGRRAYGEDLRSERGVEFRRWDPFRSKLAAFLLKGPSRPRGPARGGCSTSAAPTERP